jgi:hypothetical protein
MAACFFTMPSDSTEAPATPVTEANPPASVEDLYRQLAAKVL